MTFMQHTAALRAALTLDLGDVGDGGAACLARLYAGEPWPGSPVVPLPLPRARAVEDLRDFYLALSVALRAIVEGGKIHTKHAGARLQGGADGCS